jgi:1,4-alpha-glucan branching enzyme
MFRFKHIISFLSGLTLLLSMTYAGEAPATARYPEWAKNAVIYEVNVRQHTLEGTFKALEKDLPRLKELGVDILWLMPVYPIGVKERKGKLGSYYSIKDFKGINPEFGKESDFQSFVTKAHSMGFKVILDWVTNHTAWDNSWVSKHPDWYKKDASGKFVSPYDWTDVVALDYNNQQMRLAMIDAMNYWVEKFDIDGFRCDMAGLVPLDFWEQARPALQQKKTLFMLAEDEENIALVKKAFDMNYDWKMHHLMSKVAKGGQAADTLLKLQRSLSQGFPEDAIKMNFTTSHDENSWNGTVREKYGEGYKACAVLTYVLPGMPMIYSGQEAGLNKRLKFFEKDTIDWSDKALLPFYQALNKLKHDNAALWNPPFGGTMTVLENSSPHNIITFSREVEGNKVFVMVNLGAQPVKFSMKGYKGSMKFKDVITGEPVEIKPASPVSLGPWEYRLGVVTK